jgi:hypothetical protein
MQDEIQSPAENDLGIPRERMRDITTHEYPLTPHPEVVEVLWFFSGADPEQPQANKKRRFFLTSIEARDGIFCCT